MTERELTTLEYIVLGLISLQPQSGYDIVSFFEEGSYSWSASPGSIYPMVKRLEKQGVFSSELEKAYDTRARKVYYLTERGEKLLDEWLEDVPKMRPFYGEREVALLKFQFMEHRLSQEAILRWLDAYADAVHYAETGNKFYVQGVRAAMEEENRRSLHSELLMEANIMEINTLRTWLDMARNRIRNRVDVDA